jgi:AcrR family transcriptional regulator
VSTTRREQLLDTAAQLIAERGFHGVSMHDIGAACGVTGPAIYRHFPGKDAMLAQMLVEISERLVAEADQRSRESADALSVLRALVGGHIEFALEHPALIVVQEREWTNLQPEARDAVRSHQLAYIDRWVEAVRELRPALDRPTTRARVQAVFGMLNSTPHSARISESRMRELLARMAEAALLT